MNFIKKIILLLLLTSCANYQFDNSKKKKERIFFNSSGFAMIYEDIYFKDGLVSKKIDNTKNITMHSFLKRNTTIIIINPVNEKEIEVKINKNSDYPKIFNLVITKRIADTLKLDLENPYIEIREIKKNKTFIAKETDMFEEEKKVAEKVPVDLINVKVLSNEEEIVEKNLLKNTNFILVISDFYYLSTANDLKDKLSKETKTNDFYIEKINDNKYRLSAGPFKNFYSLKSTYISLNNLGFEDLNIYRK